MVRPLRPHSPWHKCLWYTGLVLHCWERACLDQNQHIVRSDDTLSSIAAYSGTAINAIVFRTGLTDEHCIQVGQVLRVPSGSYGSEAVGSGCSAMCVIHQEYA